MESSKVGLGAEMEILRREHVSQERDLLDTIDQLVKKSVNQEKEFEEEMANFEREITECYSVQVEEHNQRSFENVQ